MELKQKMWSKWTDKVKGMWKIMKKVEIKWKVEKWWRRDGGEVDSGEEVEKQWKMENKCTMDGRQVKNE